MLKHSGTYTHRPRCMQKKVTACQMETALSVDVLEDFPGNSSPLYTPSCTYQTGWSWHVPACLPAERCKCSRKKAGQSNSRQTTKKNETKESEAASLSPVSLHCLWYKWCMRGEGYKEVKNDERADRMPYWRQIRQNYVNYSVALPLIVNKQQYRFFLSTSQLPLKKIHCDFFLSQIEIILDLFQSIFLSSHFND